MMMMMILRQFFISKVNFPIRQFIRFNCFHILLSFYVTVVATFSLSGIISGGGALSVGYYHEHNKNLLINNFIIEPHIDVANDIIHFYEYKIAVHSC